MNCGLRNLTKRKSHIFSHKILNGNYVDHGLAVGRILIWVWVWGGRLSEFLSQSAQSELHAQSQLLLSKSRITSQWRMPIADLN